MGSRQGLRFEQGNYESLTKEKASRSMSWRPVGLLAQGRMQAFFNNLAVGNKRVSAVLQAPSALITANSTANFVSSERNLEWD